MVDLDVPVNVTGNAVGAVGGVAGAAAQDTAAAVIETHGHHHKHLRAEAGAERQHQLAGQDLQAKQAVDAAVDRAERLVRAVDVPEVLPLTSPIVVHQMGAGQERQYQLSVREADPVRAVESTLDRTERIVRDTELPQVTPLTSPITVHQMGAGQERQHQLSVREADPVRAVESTLDRTERIVRDTELPQVTPLTEPVTVHQMGSGSPDLVGTASELARPLQVNTDSVKAVGTRRWWTWMCRSM
ncbi:hypothetical protein [Marinitenerispora sediminis]|uniref:hypothetical protein n=1 Tax=Marinitenerispora sediminis TaxID=1931232 RepID=UPI0021627878|nr:hypothetical protein [Marinitenerispora sediminis]